MQRGLRGLRERDECRKMRTRELLNHTLLIQKDEKTHRIGFNNSLLLDKLEIRLICKNVIGCFYQSWVHLL